MKERERAKEIFLMTSNCFHFAGSTDGTVYLATRVDPVYLVLPLLQAVSSKVCCAYIYLPW